MGSLNASGLLGATDGASDKSKCYPPSYYQAYARNAAKMALLVKAVPEAPKTLKCSSCALVSNAGSLLDNRYGKAIDANECVWRMNR